MTENKAQASSSQMGRMATHIMTAITALMITICKSINTCWQVGSSMAVRHVQRKRDPEMFRLITTVVKHVNDDSRLKMFHKSKKYLQFIPREEFNLFLEFCTEHKVSVPMDFYGIMIVNIVKKGNNLHIRFANLKIIIWVRRDVFSGEVIELLPRSWEIIQHITRMPEVVNHNLGLFALKNKYPEKEDDTENEMGVVYQNTQASLGIFSAKYLTS